MTLALATAAAVRPVLKVAWETPLYLSTEEALAISRAADLVMGDLRFGPGLCAQELAGVADYWAAATAAAAVLARQGRLLPRHTAVPGHMDCCTKPALERLAALAPGARVHLNTSFLDGGRTLGADEREAALAWARAKGLRPVEAALGEIPPRSPLPARTMTMVVTTDGRLLVPEQRQWMATAA